MGKVIAFLFLYASIEELSIWRLSIQEIHQHLGDFEGCGLKSHELRPDLNSSHKFAELVLKKIKTVLQLDFDLDATDFWLVTWFWLGLDNPKQMLKDSVSAG